MKNDSLNSRMKNNYENRSKTFLTRRTPVIIRLDGKAFHTYTRGLDKPFDEGLIEDMEETTRYLCENIQGAKLGYTQSDEISILVTDYDNITSEAWFDYEVQKMTSVSASLATAKFNQLRTLRTMRNNIEQAKKEFLIDVEVWKSDIEEKGKFDHKLRTIKPMLKSVMALTPANFDSRVFNIPKEEVANYFLARQKDAVKNSISMLAQSLYSPKELYKKNQSDMQELCWQKGLNWNDLDYKKKRGCTILKVDKEIDTPNGKVTRGKWESVETPFNFDVEYFKNLL